MALAPTFTAVVRWRGPEPTIEIETRHPGFSSPEDAALFANAFSPNAPLALRLASKTSLQMLMLDGHYVDWPVGGVTVWVLRDAASPEAELAIADDDHFQPRPFTGFEFLPSALGDYEQAQYAVLDQKGSPVDVVVDWDERDHLRVTVRWDAAEEDGEDVQSFVGSIPQG